MRRSIVFEVLSSVKKSKYSTPQVFSAPVYGSAAAGTKVHGKYGSKQEVTYSTYIRPR